MRPAATAVLVGFCVGAAACGGEPPAPVKVAEQEPAIEPRIRPARTGPHRNPNTRPPTEREGPQLDAATLNDVRKQAAVHAADDRTAIAIETLHRCANRIPQSIECEGELALLLFRLGTRLAEAKYYLDEACMAEPATAPLRLYRELGNLALAKARFDAARAALALVTASPDATGADFAAFGRALRRDPSRQLEAIEAYERAYELDATAHDLLQDIATLRHRAGDSTGAITALTQYRDAAVLSERRRELVEQRIAKLRQAEAPEPGGDAVH